MSGLAYTLKWKLFQYQKNKNMRTARVKKDILTGFQEIKCLRDKKMFEKEFDDIFKSQITERFVSVNFRPMKIEDLNKYVAVGCSSDFLYDFRWMIYCIKKNADIINLFVKKRKEIDRLILFNQYEEALAVLKETEKICGISYWSCEYKLFLYKNLKLDTKDIREKSKNLTAFIIECCYYKNIDNITFDEYKYVIEKQIESITKNSATYDDINCYLTYILLRRQTNFTRENIMKIIKYALNDTIIDQYILALDICQMMIGKHETEKEYSIIKEYINELSEIEDDSLVALRFSYDDIENRKTYIMKEGLLEAKNDFIEGNLESCYKRVLVVLNKAPYNIEALNLYVETRTLLNREDETFKGMPIGVLIDSLEAVYALRDEREQNLEKILKLINALSKSSWAVAVDNSILGRIHQIGSEQEKKEKNIVFAQYLDIETVCYNLTKTDGVDFIETYLDTNNRYIQFRKLVLEEKYDEAGELCGLPILKNLLYVCDNKNSVQLKKDKVADICGNNAIMGVLIARCFFGKLNLERDYETGLEVATNLLISNKYTTWFLPIETYVKYLESAKLCLDTISVPILYYVYYCLHRDKKDDLAIRCDDFLYENNIRVPSEMKDYNKCTKSKLIYFLRYVCTTDILNSVICEFETSQQLEKERIDICQILCILDKSNEGVYEEEIREITQKLMINEELTIIEENRIHVNIDGIKRRMVEDFKYDYLSYQLCIDEKFKKYQKILEFINGAVKSEDKNKIVIFDETSSKPENLLKNIIINIRDAFVSSDEYGLDGYLSLNIRHGALADELRSPLVNSKLLAYYNSQNGKYEIDSKWLNSIKDVDKRNNIIEAFSVFYFETEKIISDLKNIYIQVQTEKKLSGGCFDYCLPEEVFLEMSLKTQEVAGFEEFLEIVFDYLWKRTEENLLSIKIKIKEEISNRYENAFKNLRTSLEMVEPKIKIRELNRKINESETDMQNVLDKICFWFQRSEESKHADFDLNFVFLMGLQTIHNMHPECRFVPKEIKPSFSDKKITGKYLKNFADIFYNIFDNIYQNAPKVNNEIKFDYLLNYEDGNIHILMENPYDCSGDLKRELEKIEIAKNLIDSGKYLSKIKGEGGTGIPKICKIISVDLNTQPEINFGFKKKKNKFYIELKFRKE